jgi:hypothetical protein
MKPSPIVSYIIGLLSLLQVCVALKFSVPAQEKNAHARCIRDFVTKDTLVVVNVKSSGYQGDGQTLNVYISDNRGNEYGRSKSVTDSARLAFTAHSDVAFDVCFENLVDQTRRGQQLSRNIELDVEIGANARDWNHLQAVEKLKPTEVELRRIEDLTDEIARELEYLKIREARLRDTNESTNNRVQNFSVGIILSLLSLGTWQIWYLRKYFRSKHII